MANTHSNAGATFARPVHGTAASGTTAATTHRTEDKPQNRTIIWVVAGVILLAAIIWATTRTGGTDNTRMDGRASEQVAPTRP